MIQPGAIVGEAWAMYRAHWRHLIPVAFVVYLLLALFTLLVAALVDAWLAFIVSTFVTIAGAFWVQGALVETIADVRDGRRDLSLSQTLERIAPRVNALGLAGVLAGIGVAIGLLLFIVPGLVLLTWWSVLVPVLILERTRTLEAFGRSRELVSGHGWQVFGVVVLTFLVVLAVSIATTLVFSWLDDTIEVYVRDVVAPSLSAPFATLAWTLTYYRLRELRPA